MNKAVKQQKETKKKIEKNETTEKNNQNEKDQFKDSIDPNKVDKFGEVLQRQIKVDQLMTITRN